MSFLKPKQARSDNVNRGLITSTYGGQMNQGTGATNFLAQLLGVAPGGGAGSQSQAGYNNYLQMAGYQPAMREMSRATVGQGAASGLLNSGATAKALQTRGAEINQSFFNNYLQQLAGLSGLGLQAGGLVANVGNRSTGGGPSTAGSIASTVGGIASIFSDRRLKRDIERVDEFSDGLGIYEFRYLTGAKRVLGVMADEVAKLRPWALGPKRAGFDTVNYGAL